MVRALRRLEYNRSVVSSVFIMAAVAMISACGENNPAGPLTTALSPHGQNSGKDTVDGTIPVPPPGPATGPGPVVGVRLIPASLTIRTGEYGALLAEGLNAAGEVVLGAQATWASSAPSVAVVSDTGLVQGVSPGSATVTATIEGHPASASVTVTDGADAEPPVTQLDLEFIVRGATTATDTTQSELLPGAAVALYQTASGGSSISDVPMGTRTTNAAGEAEFQALLPGWFRVDVTPPGGSPFEALTLTISRTSASNLPIVVVLRRKS